MKPDLYNVFFLIIFCFADYIRYMADPTMWQLFIVICQASITCLILCDLSFAGVSATVNAFRRSVVCKRASFGDKCMNELLVTLSHS